MGRRTAKNQLAFELGSALADQIEGIMQKAETDGRTAAQRYNFALNVLSKVRNEIDKALQTLAVSEDTGVSPTTRRPMSPEVRKKKLKALERAREVLKEKRQKAANGLQETAR